MAAGWRDRSWKTFVPRPPETHRRAPPRLRGAFATVLLLAATAAAADGLRPFTATYTWIWSGMTVAVTTVKLEQSGETWTYTTHSEPRGIGKMMPQRPKTVSVVRITDDGVQPLSYQGDDGTSSDKRSIDVRYDWDHHRVTGTYEQTKVDLPLTAEVQDDSSIQLALMVALLRGKIPDRLELLDKNSVREYHYQRARSETLQTAIGPIATVVYTSQKAFSPRVNSYWCAPERGFIPVRVQQKKGDEVEWTLEVQSLQRQ
jgi:Protein of unknown function (DUF3108)